MSVSSAMPTEPYGIRLQILPRTGLIGGRAVPELMVGIPPAGFICNAKKPASVLNPGIGVAALLHPDHSEAVFRALAKEQEG
jgi:hypothetical protein